MWPFQGDFYEKLREVPFPEIMAPKDKSYYVLTDAETPYPDGLPPLGAKHKQCIRQFRTRKSINCKGRFGTDVMKTLIK
jgi:hypothetical protein|eukprot:COSAG06_NODE_370_length_16728_cov_5.639004_15_plen_79_part_00